MLAYILLVMPHKLLVNLLRSCCVTQPVDKADVGLLMPDSHGLNSKICKKENSRQFTKTNKQARACDVIKDAAASIVF